MSDSAKVRKDMDTTYPEPLSVLRKYALGPEHQQSFFKRQKKKDVRRGTRFRTQPVTFDEIKEVDEETGEDVELPGAELASSMSHGDIRVGYVEFPRDKAAARRLEVARERQRERRQQQQLDQLEHDQPQSSSTASSSSGGDQLQDVSKELFTWLGKARQGSI